ncbi:hypothetical protein BN1708_013262 [Verticillium longisporum]|uniref:Zn(2)-C6 fungal-type domain-containing protein n=1 Tax=Verticillium longisporum TaxID=100787 RepID=A0A0G4LJA1_VERLO|nr:hypothetical protein BN1708_013262 [Verticillium longisporum]
MSIDRHGLLRPFQSLFSPRNTNPRSLIMPTASSSKLKHILPNPAPSHIAEPCRNKPHPTRLSATHKRSYVFSACAACRKRKGKCTGRRPQCRPYTKRHQVCAYDTEPAETQMQACRRQNEVLMRENLGYLTLPGLLISLPDNEAIDMLGKDGDILLNYRNRVFRASPPPPLEYWCGQRYSDLGPTFDRRT